ncbi:MAG: recombinase family protein [Bacteroidales bacterium]|nr:recombinase family protein [Bacteroidales bacterium]
MKHTRMIKQKEGVSFTMKMITPQELSLIDVYKIIIYLRKSRSEGKESVEEVLYRHEKILQDFAIQTFGQKIPEENIYREVVSGETLDERIEIKKVFNRLEKEEIKALLVVEPQRISRGDMLDCGRVVRILRYTETLCVTVTKTYDLNNKFDRELFEAQLSQGNKYLEYSKEIMDRGKALSIREGKYIGSTAPFGYDRKALDKGFMLVKHKIEAPIVETIFNLFVNEDLTTKEISSYLNKHQMESRSKKPWNYNMVRHILKHEVYYGSLAWGKRPVIRKLIDGDLTKFRTTAEEYMLVRGMQEPIVSKEVWDIAQEKIKGRALPKTTDGRELKNPLAGIVFCKKCGYSLVRIKNARDSKARKKVRKYKLDKEGLNKLLREAKEKKSISLQEIADFIETPKYTVASWLSPNLERVYYNEKFDEKWFELKFILEIDTDEFDKQILTYTEPAPLKDTLMCSNQNCNMVSCCLQSLEKSILEKLKLELKNFNYYVDNYEEEIVKERVSSKKAITKLNNKIAGLKVELKNLMRARNREEFTYDQYIELKKDIDDELRIFEEQLAELQDDEQVDTLTRYKKVIPELSKCLNEYNKMSIPEKNESLKSIIDRVIYSKTKRLNWRKNEPDDMKIHIELKI